MNEKLLTDLFKAYYDARQNKRNTLSQLRFEMDLEDNLLQLYHEIDERRYHVGRSICFMTNIPVKREIFAADFRDRVVHHLLCNYVSPLFERTFITDSYSCRKGMGTHFGIGRLEHHIRSCSNNYQWKCYLLKLDIQGYFMNINRELLFGIIMQKLDRFASRRAYDGKTWAEVLDYDLVRYLAREIVFNDPTENCEVRGNQRQWIGLPPSKSLFHTPDGCGLPIGNLTSQLFSNVYLSKLDDFIKRTLRVKHYGRYVDDFYIVGTDRARLMQLVPIIRNFLKEELGLQLHPDKIYLQEVTKGVNFLGANIKPYRRYLVNKTKRRINRQLSSAAYRPQHLMVATVNSYLGYMRHLCCQNYIRRLIERNP
ncbi:MAG: reverse transcriptase/maturase family protein, partial [Alistipes sp.]|nr:reverse transcriptase/maturase family protein [Alistipes sp.]